MQSVGGYHLLGWCSRDCCTPWDCICANLCILWENLISKAPFYYKMMFSKHYKKMFCENIYHICQSRCNHLNTNNIKTDRYTPKTGISTSPSTSLSAILSCATGTSFHHNRNIIPPQPEHHSTTTGTLFHHNRNIILALPEPPSLATSIRH